jgi:hypothetical protein
MLPMEWNIFAKPVMPGVLAAVKQERRGWPGTPIAKTRFALLPGHDEKTSRVQAVRRGSKMQAVF